MPFFRGPVIGVLSVLAATLTASCGGGVRPFPLEEPMWEDPDQQAFLPKPEEYFSPFAWDAADQTVFRPISRFFAVDPAGEAKNVNAVDEVPDSSWFTNRAGLREVTPEEIRKGPCPDRELDPEVGPWTVTDAKPNGANPGFIIEDPDGRKWLLKFDGLEQPERATSADVVGSRLYWAAGYHTPCNIIVFFDPDILEIADDAESETEDGEDRAMVPEDIDTILSKGVEVGEGRYRASASLFLEGTPIGPWQYQGTRDDDPNDVVPHEDRRDLRGMYVLASWINHFDSREQNTLATWLENDEGEGWVRHNMIDWGDSFGSQWDYEGITRRLGHAYYLDIPYLVEDFLTLGLIDRPWDDPEYGPAGVTLTYFDVTDFEPDAWRPGYPNPAFVRMSERDAAWMARIIAHMDPELIDAALAEARIQNEVVLSELRRILRGRRERILGRWFEHVSPLAHPALVERGERTVLCYRDLAVETGTVPAETRRYAGRAWLTISLDPAPLDGLGKHDGSPHHVCAPLPEVPGASPEAPQYLIVDVAGLDAALGSGAEPNPARAHLYHLGGGDYRLVGLERPYDADPPGE